MSDLEDPVDDAALKGTIEYGLAAACSSSHRQASLTSTFLEGYQLIITIAMESFLQKYVFRDLYQPHTWFTFDGPYTRLQMDDGSSFITIMSSVWRAKSRPHLCHISYSPLPEVSSSKSNEVVAFACDFYPDHMHVKRRKQDDANATAAFSLDASIPSEGTFNLNVDDARQTYRHRFTHPKTQQVLDLSIDISESTPHSLLGPMWIARFLPVPLKWHVYSTRSRASVTIKEGEKTLMNKTGLAHQEKNWGLGFPSAWIWCQGFATPAKRGSLAIAGGQVTSFLSAFMLAYRSPTSHRKWDFGPAWTMQLFGFKPFCDMTICNSERGLIELQCVNPIRGQKIKIRGQADPATFQVMSAPLPDGHTPWYCHESFEARYDVTLFERKLFGEWMQVEEVQLENSALEFGGDWSHWWTRLSKERQEALKHGKED